MVCRLYRSFGRGDDVRGDASVGIGITGGRVGAWTAVWGSAVVEAMLLAGRPPGFACRFGEQAFLGVAGC